MLGQYRPYYEGVANMRPWLRDNKPVVEGPMLGFNCNQGHNTFVNLNAIVLGVAGEYKCITCDRDPAEVHARIYVEAKLGIRLQLCSTRAGAVYTCTCDEKVLKVAIGDQLEPVAHPRMLLPATTNEATLGEAWNRYVDELATQGN